MRGLIEKFVFDFNLAFIVIQPRATSRDNVKVKRTHEKLVGMSLGWGWFVNND